MHLFCDTPWLSTAAGVIAGFVGGAIGLGLRLDLSVTIGIAAGLALLGEGLIHARDGWPTEAGPPNPG